MDELNAKENLFQLWMIYTTKTDFKALQEYIQLFVDCYSDLIDVDFTHLENGFSEEGPHLTTLPDGILQVFGNQLHQCCFSVDPTSVQSAIDLLKCLIVLCRNYDNVQLVASCEFSSHAITIATTVTDKLKDDPPPEDFDAYILFLKVTLHFFECLYDPYFTWRKQLLGWRVDGSRLRFKSALLHVEVIPYFHDCFHKAWLPVDIKLRLVHLFGALIAGAQHNALKAITPATLDVLLGILATRKCEKPTNEMRQEHSLLTDLVLKCLVKMVHVIHCCSPDQRQVEVSQLIEGYMNALLETVSEADCEAGNQRQLHMIETINGMLACEDRTALQVLMVSGGTFDMFVSLLQKTTLSGVEAQSLAVSVLSVMRTVLAGSGNAKELFHLRVGFGRLLDVLKSLGQPSMSLLKSVLNLVVEGQYEEKIPFLVHNSHAAIMLIQWLPDIQSHDLQIWLAENLRALCCSEHNNKMKSCNDGMISAILSVLAREKQINPSAVSHLIGLLETLGTLSITAIELKQLVGLLRLDEEEKQNTYYTRLMRSMSTMARREGKEGALHFFNIQEPTDGILLPAIRKWPGTAFGFHAWLCLNTFVDNNVHNVMSGQPYRRNLYSFLSNSGCGFDAFITTDGEMVISVHGKKDNSVVTVPDTDLLDGHWHSVCITHTNSKRPFITSHLNVYLDGKLKQTAQLKYPIMSEALMTSRVGAPVHNKFAGLQDCQTSQSQDHKKLSPLKSLIQSATKSNNSIPGVTVINVGTEEDFWGPCVPLCGQIGSVCIFHEALTASQVKALYIAGPNNLTVFNDVHELNDLQAKMVLHYNAKACKGSHCLDLSDNANHGVLTGHKCVTWDIKDMINCIGGIQVLFPLLEQVNRVPLPVQLKSPEVPFLLGLNRVQDQDDWVVLPSSSYADTKLEQNQVAGFLTLLRNMIQTKPVNQQTFVLTSGAAVIGALLQKVNQKLIDVHVLMAVQLLVEAIASTNRTLLNHLYQYILFDFRIWSRSDFPVRIGHIQYLSTIIKDDRRYFRKMFGVQYFLDVIRLHYSEDCVLSEEDSRTIRVSLLSLVKYFVVKDITAEELNTLLTFMLGCRQEVMICEALDLLISLLESSRRQDQLYLLMFEQGMGESLYGLLTIRGYTIIYYEKIVKVLYLLLKTDRVYEKSKNRLRLLDCGYLGLINLIQGFEVSGPTIKRFLEQVSVTDTPQSYQAVLAVLQLINTSGFDIKLEASRQLLSILVSKNGAAKNFAKQLGWQEAFTKLFILDTMADGVEPDLDSCESALDILGTEEDSKVNNNPELGASSKEHYKGDNSDVGAVVKHSKGGDSQLSATDKCSMGSNSDIRSAENNSKGDICGIDTEASSKGDNLDERNSHRLVDVDNVDKNKRDEKQVPPVNGADSIKCAISDDLCVQKASGDAKSVCDTKTCDSAMDQNKRECDNRTKPSVSKIQHPTSLPLSDSVPSELSKVEFYNDEPLCTPMYLKTNLFEDLTGADDEYPLSRSSSTSAEDLSAIAARANERKSLAKEARSSSISQLSLSESGYDLAQENPELLQRRESISSHANSAHRMLDSLGLRGSFLMETVEDSEELCQNLLIILYTIMWQGVEGSDAAAWKERGQVFSWFDYLSGSHSLICPAVELKRRLLEMMLHACASDIRDAGHTSSKYMENAVELVRLVRHFLATADPNNTAFGEMLLEDAMSLLDSLAVWDVQSGAGWQEMVHLGLSIILAFTQQSQLELCASATARLHMLVQTKLITSSAEASFLIYHLNEQIIRAIKGKTDNYSFLIPVMKALIDKSDQLLSLDINLPTLPSTSMSPTFFDDFKSYCFSEEWTHFIDNYIRPQNDHFLENVFQEPEEQAEKYWSGCHEEMMLNLHKQNRERGESKIKFQDQILSVYQKKLVAEERRFLNLSIQARNQHFSTLRQWRATKRFFTGERGAWAEKQDALHWKLSNQENFSRMKVKLIQNYAFDIHKDASLLRDNLGIEDEATRDELQHLAVAKEALVSKDNIADDVIGDEEWNVISSSNTGSEDHQEKEKLVLSEECELVTLVEVINGRLEVTTTHVYFFDCSSSRDEGGEDFKWSLSQLREIHFRRYNLRRSALEMFLVDQTNYFLNFQKKVRNKVYSRILSLRPPNLIYYGSRSPAELLKASGLVQKWVQRDISNFEYLMQLNTIAGRTYNDLSQYPVFPWILCDYTSRELDLNNPEMFRDLSKPMGVMNPNNEEEIREKYDHFEDPSGVIEKFHYGTHYSNAATVMHYMIRMEPFTTLHIALQSGRFDVADRQFHSVPGTWRSMYNNPNDVKELIPEFFYLPEFLSNTNKFDLGRLQISRETVGDVILPNWADTPEDFIYKHRQALESEYVSSHLHHWIDLIFGFKQKGPAAAEALNVFYYCTYEGAVDLDAVKDPSERKALEGMINNFGQTPCQLLKDPHPQRLTFDEVVARSLKTDKHLSVFSFLQQLKVYFVEVSSETDPLAYITVPRSQVRSIIQHGMPDTMVTVSKEGIIGTHGWLPYDKNITNYFTFERDPSVSNPKTKKKLICPFTPGLAVTATLFVVSHDCKLLFSAGHWDNSLQVYHIGKGRRINHICRHIDIVTCLALDYCGSHLITGSRDTTCMIWKVLQQGGVSQGLNTKPVQILYGHDDEVTAVHISTELDLAVSASKDGTVMLHTVRKGHYMRTLRPPCTESYYLQIPYIVVDDMGHIIVNCHEKFPVKSTNITSLHLYSLNGKHLRTEKLHHPLSHMIIKEDHLITGDVVGNLVIYEIFGLRQLTSIPLYVPIHSLSMTNGNSHVLVGLRDGKLIIVGIKNRSEVIGL